MKKTLLTIALLLLMLLQSAMLSGCDFPFVNGDDNCTHRFKNDACVICNKLATELFVFTYINGSDSYSIKAKENAPIPRVLYIPSTHQGKAVTVIEEDAFRYSCIAELIIPDSIIKIGSAAFYGCSDLFSLDVPDSVTLIEKGAFYLCKKLNNVSIGAGVTEIQPLAFGSCYDLVSVTISEENEVFYSRYNTIIEKETKTLVFGTKCCQIPDDVTAIADAALADVPGLISVTIPKSVAEIGYGAFSCSDDLEEIIFEDPFGWSANGVSPISATDLMNPQTAAEYLTSNDYYANSYLSKK